MRAFLATLLVAVGLAAVLVVQTMGYVGRDAVISDRFSDVAVAALQTPEGRALVSGEITRAVEDAAAARGIPLPAPVRGTLGPAVERAVASPAFADAVRPAVESAHRRLLDDPSAGAEIRLGALRDQVVAAVRPYGDRLVVLVPPAESFPAVRVPLPEGAEPVVRAARALRDGWPLAILVMLVAFGTALWVADRPARVAAAIGAGLLVLAVVPVLVRLVVPVLVDRAAPEGVEPLADELAERMLAGWLQAAAWTAAAGVAMLLAARALAPGRSPGRRARRR